MRLGLPVLTILIALTTHVAGCNFFDSTCDEATDPACLGRDLTGKNEGSACIRTVQCDPYLICIDNTCETAHTTIEGGDCRRTAECVDGLYCDYRRVCAPAGDAELGDSCTGTADCTSGLVCSLGAIPLKLACVQPGDGDKGEACTHTLECAAGLTCNTLIKPYSCRSAPAVDMEIPTIPIWDGSGPNGVTCADVDEPVAYHEVPLDGQPLSDFYRLPFPNDIRSRGGRIDLSDHPYATSEGDGALGLGLPMVERFIKAADGSRGFSTNPVVFFRFSQDFIFGDVSSSTARIVDITPSSPDYDKDASLKWHAASSNYICDNWLSLRRPVGHPLRPGTTYAAILTTNIHPQGGGSFTRSNQLIELLGNSTPGDSDMKAAWDAYAPLRAWLEDTNTPATALLNVAVFTTANPSDIMSKLHGVVQDNAPPQVSDLIECASGVTSPCEDADGRGACINSAQDYIEIHGRISLPSFQAGDSPYMPAEEGTEAGKVPVDGDGRVAGSIAESPEITGRQDVCFALAIPNGSPPAGGWPLMIYGHGTGGVFTSPLAAGWAQELAKGATPAATLGFDLPMHGERRGGSTEEPDLLFFNVVNPAAGRGNVLQGSADMMSIVRWARAGGISAGDSPTGSAIDFDPSRIAVFGHSQGATHAALMLPFEDGLISGVLSGVGGHLTTSLLNKTEPLPIADALGALMLDLDGTKLAGRENNPALAIIQSFYDSADPINYAHLLHSEPPSEAPNGHHVFMTYGLNDHYSPEQTQKAYAVAGKLPHVGFVLSDLDLDVIDPPASNTVDVGGVMRTVGVKQYEPVPVGGETPDGHFVSVKKGQDGYPDVARFLIQSLTGQTPVIGK